MTRACDCYKLITAQNFSLNAARFDRQRDKRHVQTAREYLANKFLTRPRNNRHVCARVTLALTPNRHVSELA